MFTHSEFIDDFSEDWYDEPIEVFTIYEPIFSLKFPEFNFKSEPLRFMYEKYSEFLNILFMKFNNSITSLVYDPENEIATISINAGMNLSDFERNLHKIFFKRFLGIFPWEYAYELDGAELGDDYMLQEIEMEVTGIEETMETSVKNITVPINIELKVSEDFFGYAFERILRGEYYQSERFLGYCNIEKNKNAKIPCIYVDFFDSQPM